MDGNALVNQAFAYCIALANAFDFVPADQQRIY